MNPGVPVETVDELLLEQAERQPVELGSDVVQRVVHEVAVLDEQRVQGCEVLPLRDRRHELETSGRRGGTLRSVA